MLIVSASAGTGKTFTVTRIINNILLSNDRDKLRLPDDNGLTLKVDNLDNLVKWLKENVPEDFDLDSLAAITFTEKAAAELINRIRESLERSEHGNKKIILAKLARAKISTIHSFCLRILQQSLTSVDMEPWFIDPNIEVLNTIIDDNLINKTRIRVLDKNKEWFDKFREALEKIRKFNKEAEKKIDVDFSALMKFSSDIIKKHFYLLALEDDEINYPEEYIDGVHKLIVDFSKEIYKEIRKTYLRENRIDFNAILYETYQYLKNSKKSVQEINEKLKLIIVDEFQDTDPLQWKILNMLDAKKILVGDIKQSIYRFRGAFPEIFGDLSKKYTPIRLTTNFRSTKFINDFVEKTCNKGFFEENPTSIKTAKKDRGSNSVYFVDPFSNYTYIVKLIKWIKDNELIDNYGKITVLSRRKEELINLKDELKKYTIKSAFIESISLFNKSEIIPLKAFLTLLNDSQRDDALLAYLTYIPFSIDENEIYANAKEEHLSLIERLKETKNKEISYALKIYDKYRNLKEFASISKILNMFMEETRYLPKISGLPDGEERYINVVRFMETVKNLENAGYQLSEISEKVNEEDSIESKSLYENDPDSLKLMTIHKSKGLENSVIIYLNPYRKTKDNDSIKVEKENDSYKILVKKLSKSEHKEDLEEQRLFYVGITRAKEYLFMINEKKKIRKNNKNELLEDYVYFEDGSWKKDNGDLKKLGEFLTENTINEVELGEIEVKERAFEKTDVSLNYINDYTHLAYKKFHSPTKLYKYEELLQDTEEEPYYITEILKNDSEDEDEEEIFLDDYGYWREKEEGVAVHRLLEHLKRPLTLKQVLKKYFDFEMKFIDEEKKKKIYDNLSMWINSEFFKELAQNTEEYNEFKIDKTFKIGNREFILTGVIDKIYKLPDGSWNIIDYKYAIHNKSNMKKYRFQLEFYAFCMKDILKINKLKLVFLREKPQNGVRTFKFDEINFENFMSKLSNHILREENS